MTDPGKPTATEPRPQFEGAVEAQLRAEIESLKRQLQEHRAQMQRPSGSSLALIGLLVLVLITCGFFLGYVPRQRREKVLAAESREQGEALPVVNVALVKRSAAQSSLVLPGNIQAITDSPVLARATGYLRKRYADIGDRVEAGKALAEIEAPELDQQVRQAKAAVDQAASTVQQAEAALEQSRANTALAKVTADRWKNLVGQGVVSRQDFDTRDAQYTAQLANDRALEKALAAARSNAAAAEANLARLNDLLGYQTVKAPFAGVITVRNVDVGALVTEGNTLLFRIAQSDRLRTYVNVPQGDAESVRVGQRANLAVAERSGRKFDGTVTRTANALDPATRTLLVEVQVSNAGGALLPGMYAQVDLAVPRKSRPLVIPSDTLVFRTSGPQAAVVNEVGAVHFANLELGRDFGDHVEVLHGLDEGQPVIVNPSDVVREGAKVKAVSEKGSRSK
jgi:RND family efflux transporter MFP subunit